MKTAKYTTIFNIEISRSIQLLIDQNLIISNTYGNDMCARHDLATRERNFILWIDHKQKSKRESEGYSRYTIIEIDEDEQHLSTDFESNSTSKTIDFVLTLLDEYGINKHKFEEPLLEQVKNKFEENNKTYFKHLEQDLDKIIEQGKKYGLEFLDNYAEVNEELQVWGHYSHKDLDSIIDIIKAELKPLFDKKEQEKQKALFVEKMVSNYNWENVFNMFKEADTFSLCELKEQVKNEIFDTLEEL